MQRAYLFLIATTLLWSGNFVVGRATNDSIGPLSVIHQGAGYAGGHVLLSPWLYKAMFSKKGLNTEQWIKMAVMAIIGVSCI